MRWHKGFAALLVMLLSLGGRAHAVVGQGQAPHAPYSYDERGSTRGGGEGGGGM
jgi:hypothetical protein